LARNFSIYDWLEIVKIRTNFLPEQKNVLYEKSILNFVSVDYRKMTGTCRTYFSDFPNFVAKYTRQLIRRSLLKGRSIKNGKQSKSQVETRDASFCFRKIKCRKSRIFVNKPSTKSKRCGENRTQIATGPKIEPHFYLSKMYPFCVENRPKLLCVSKIEPNNFLFRKSNQITFCVENRTKLLFVTTTTLTTFSDKIRPNLKKSKFYKILQKM
jgi:hypothetical protein